MNADVQGALDRLNLSYRCFEHKGKRMTKTQVGKVLKYAIQKGYKHTVELSDKEIDDIISKNI